MEIKTSLKDLITLFRDSASNEKLPKPIQQFAAQLSVLTAHVGRVDAKINALATTMDEQVGELATHIIAIREGAAPAPIPAPASPPPQQSAAADVDMDEDEAAKAMAEQVLRETEAEVAALSKASPPTSVVKQKNRTSMEGAS